jgi:Arc/MetJ-type ribon-helix-helix transcriptional regulator
VTGSASDGDHAAVELPERVLSRIERRVEHTDFDSTSAYVTFVLEEVLASVEADDLDDTVDEDEVRDRLRSLGYLDE